MLQTYAFGPEATAQTPPLLIAHGLYGSARNWNVIAKRMSANRPVISVDMRNHGDSPRAAQQGYKDMAADLADVIAACPGGKAHVMGHSMGGKAAMALALTKPEHVASLLVADIAPVSYGHTQLPLAKAMMAMEISDLTSRGAADARLAAEVDDPGTRAFLLQSLDLRANPPRWKLNLPVLAAEMDKIIGWPDTLTGPCNGPVLFLSGGASDYVQRAHRPRIKTLFPTARFASLPEAGHWLHADKPRAFEASLAAWLERVER